MNRYILAIIFLIRGNQITFSQVEPKESLEVEGRIRIGNSTDKFADPGTIRFNEITRDFEGWNGTYWVSLTRLQQPGNGVSDIDGSNYRTVRIGSQEWMAENLKTSKYYDNTPIAHETSNAIWAGLNTGAWCWYLNLNSYETAYGILYDGYAMNTGKLCPSGWHIPSDMDWQILVDYLGGTEIAGGRMKETGTAHWDALNAGATNDSGFTATGAGSRNAFNGDFFDIKEAFFWWTQTNSFGNYYFIWSLYFGNIAATQYSYHPRSGLSVRCIRD